MPIRAFVTQDLTQLAATLASLEKAMQGGSLEELRVSGIVTRTGPVSQDTLQLRYQQARYEIYLRITALDDSDENKAALVAQYGDTNPYLEKIMRVETQQRLTTGGSFLYGTV